jgi:hypothetical protein
MNHARNPIDPPPGPQAHRPHLSRRQAKFLRKGLRRLGHRTYSDYLGSPHWQALRLRFARSGRPKRCAVCHDPAYELHHRTYRRLGRERLDDLVALCHRHHEAIHGEGLPLWDGHRVLRERERLAASDVRDGGVDDRGPDACTHREGGCLTVERDGAGRKPSEPGAPAQPRGSFAGLAHSDRPARDADRCDGCRQFIGLPESGMEELVRFCRDCEDELSWVDDPSARDDWEPGTEIPRGLPRPIYKGRPLPWVEKSERLTPFGGPIDSERAADDERLDVSWWLTPLQDAEKLAEAWEDGLCILCGEPLTEEVFFFSTDGRALVQGGLHPRCAKLTRAHCPGVNWGGWDTCRAPRASWDELRRAAPSPGHDYPNMSAPLPDECGPVPEWPRRAPDGRVHLPEEGDEEGEDDGAAGARAR